jgi:hypothetical protein
MTGKLDSSTLRCGTPGPAPVGPAAGSPAESNLKSRAAVTGPAAAVRVTGRQSRAARCVMHGHGQTGPAAPGPGVCAGPFKSESLETCQHPAVSLRQALDWERRGAFGLIVSDNAYVIRMLRKDTFYIR